MRSGWGALTAVALALAGCNYVEKERELGYKGQARINPWLAAERFIEARDGEVRSLRSWEEPDWYDAVWFVPAFVLSNESFNRRMEEWVLDGGHLVVLVERADSQTSDWSSYRAEAGLSAALRSLLERAGLELDESGRSVEAEEITYEDEVYRVKAAANTTVAETGGEPGLFASVGRGDGRLTVVADARIFRNRWIGDEQHADLLAALVEDADADYPVVFLRSGGLTIWGMLGRHLWPVLLAVGVLLVLWLWKNLTRFGPLDARADTPPPPAYERHLEALGDFQWRLDGGTALLIPLREQLIEHGQHLAARTGHRDSDFFQFLADRAQLPRERVFRALAETAPADAVILTRTAADLQRLSQALKSTSP